MLYGHKHLFGCRFNTPLSAFVTRQFKRAKPCCLRPEAHREDKMGEDVSACNTSMVLLNKGDCISQSMLNVHRVLFIMLVIPNLSFTGQTHNQEAPPVIMVDELLILNPHKLSFSEAGLRIMITPHFSPRTRLSMAGRMLISEVCETHARHCSTVVSELHNKFLTLFSQRQRLIQTSKNQRDSEIGPGSTSNSLKRTGSCSLENGGGRPGMGDTESGDKSGAVCLPREEEDDEDGIFHPIHIPGNQLKPH